jgi:hypothetical protein
VADGCTSPPKEGVLLSFIALGRDGNSRPWVHWKSRRLSEVLNVFIFRAKSNSPRLEPETSHFALLFILVEEVWDSVFRHSLQMFSDFFL